MKILFTKRVDINNSRYPDCNITQYYIVTKFIYAVAFIWPNDPAKSYVSLFPIVEDFDKNGCVGNDKTRHYDSFARLDTHYERFITVDRAIAVLRGAIEHATVKHRYIAEDASGISYDEWIVRMKNSTGDVFTFTKMRNAPEGVIRTIKIDRADLVHRCMDECESTTILLDNIPSHTTWINLNEYNREAAYGVRL